MHNITAAPLFSGVKHVQMWAAYNPERTAVQGIHENGRAYGRNPVHATVVNPPFLHCLKLVDFPKMACTGVQLDALSFLSRLVSQFSQG